jgi:hypothetical protein
VRWRKRDKKPTEGGRPQSSRIDRALFPVFGPAQVGPYDTPEREYVPVDEECSVCFRPMSLHTTDRSGGRSRIVCPPLSAQDVRALPSGR